MYIVGKTFFWLFLFASILVFLSVPAVSFAAVLYSQPVVESQDIGTTTDNHFVDFGTGLSGTLRGIYLRFAPLIQHPVDESTSAILYENGSAKRIIVTTPQIGQTDAFLDFQTMGFNCCGGIFGGTFTFDSSKTYKINFSFGTSNPYDFGLFKNQPLGRNSGTQNCWHDNVGGSDPCSIKEPFWVMYDSAVYIPTISNDIATSTTLQSDKIYAFSGDVEILSGVTLTIKPGAIVKFLTSTSTLTVSGTLEVEGTVASTTFLTSNSSTPAAGDWGGIQINAGGDASFDHAFIQYGGSVGGSNAMIYNNGGNLIISNSSVIKGSDYGIKNSSGTTTVTNTNISHNTHGLYFTGGSATVSATSTIHDNSSYGVYNSTGTSINVENNYWGDPSGPTHASNPGGTGDVVSNNVDFDPWVGNLHYVISERIPECISDNNCWSVQASSTITLYNSTTYISALSAATSTWNALGTINLIATTSSPAADLLISDVNDGDLAWVGLWRGVSGGQDTLELNTYYLGTQSESLRQNTILHELGHALGLDHSYFGNVMFFQQTAQTTLAPQDLLDYDYLW